MGEHEAHLKEKRANFEKFLESVEPLVPGLPIDHFREGRFITSTDIWLAEAAFTAFASGDTEEHCMLAFVRMCEGHTAWMRDVGGTTPAGRRELGPGADLFANDLHILRQLQERPDLSMAEMIRESVDRLRKCGAWPW